MASKGQRKKEHNLVKKERKRKGKVKNWFNSLTVWEVQESPFFKTKRTKPYGY